MPGPGDIAFGKTNVALAQHLTKRAPLVELEIGVRCAVSNGEFHSIGQFQMQTSVLDFLQQVDYLTGVPGGVAAMQGSAQTGGIHSVTSLSGCGGLRKNGTRLINNRIACRWMRASTPQVING